MNFFKITGCFLRVNYKKNHQEKVLIRKTVSTQTSLEKDQTKSVQTNFTIIKKRRINFRSIQSQTNLPSYNSTAVQTNIPILAESWTQSKPAVSGLWTQRTPAVSDFATQTIIDIRSYRNKARDTLERRPRYSRNC